MTFNARMVIVGLGHSTVMKEFLLFDWFMLVLVDSTMLAAVHHHKS